MIRWKRLSLRARIFVLLAALMVTTLTGGVVTMWYTQAMDSVFNALVDKSFASFQAAEELETSLLMQKGFLTYYFLDANPDWLKQLNSYQQDFETWLQKARQAADTEAMVAILSQIDQEYQSYLDSRTRVIQLYQAGEREAGARLHQEARRQFYNIYSLCERAKLIQESAIARARTESQTRARFINVLALTVMPGVAVLGIMLAYILIKQILQPIRQLTLQTDPGGSDSPLPDEVKALSRRVYHLMEDMDQAQSQLERSQERLLESKKLAMVGKLAAGVAHSIRNPLTSVKMRLFSLGRSLDLSFTQKEDFEVIAAEIRHIDTIVRDFLEFSRPPKLKMQQVSPSDVVDRALTLLNHRLESYGVRVELRRPARLPDLWGDPEQLKEVLVNLLINACEAMAGGGQVTISEADKPGSAGRLAVLEVRDSGPGVPTSIQDKIFQPFFSTKEEGTGLGLSIAARIVEEHGGCLEVTSQEGQGATFRITLPYKEETAWAKS